jgi:hypothetical protein
MSPRNQRSGYPIGRAARLLLVGWSLFLVAGFAVAYSVEPDPRGFGTHQRLGLPECSFKLIFDIPCPSCGMTTSFANFTRGRFADAARANIAGLLLAVVSLVMIPWCWAGAYRGRLWGVDQPDMALLWLLLVLAGVCLLQWGTRLTIG